MKFPSGPTVTLMDSSFCPSAILVSNWREISGRSVLVRMLSTLRAPLSTSVQRLPISSISASLQHRRRAAMQAPADLTPVAMLPVGYAAETPDPTPRRRLADLAK